MLVLITYDVSTETPAGRKRLRQIAKACVNYGQRVQNSVFECSLDASQYRTLQAHLLEIMDQDEDSLRFYNLGSNYRTRIEHFGRNSGYDPEGLLVL
jgi:CRISPR-associated protein Cas2